MVDKSISNFYPLTDDPDGTKWNSEDPIDAVIRIDIPAIRVPTSAWLPWISGKTINDNAAVVCSESDEQHWRFSTVKTPQTGQHPVSGTREWAMCVQP